MQISDYFKDVFIGYEFNSKKSIDEKELEICPGGSLIATRIFDHEKKIIKEMAQYNKFSE